ncbi:MAG: hypothetical protein Q8S13_10455, partial [Dehalococcoidia bacterium]|nr:hypothetical protein [Dehalococcoidia bacterium]
MKRRSFLFLGAGAIAMAAMPRRARAQTGVAWFLVPYKIKLGGALGRKVRYCAMNDFTAAIQVGGGDWSEVQIKGDQAIVRVRARAAVLASLASVFRRLSDTEAIAAWTPTCFKPRYNTATDMIEFTTEETPSTPLAKLLERITSTAPSEEQILLARQWNAVGFGEGWRLPRSVIAWAVRNGIEPDRLDDLVIPVVFPTTGLLDAFTRADENPLANGTWAGTYFSAGAACKLVSNAAKAADVFANSYWSAATFGPDSEAFCTVTTLANQEACDIRLQAPGTTGVDGYEGFVNNTPAGQIFQIDNEVETQIGADISLSFSAG